MRIPHHTSEGNAAGMAAPWASGEEAKAGPLVTVLLPTFNRRRYLPQALASVLQQTYRNLEIFVVNDGGEDVADVVRECSDSRVVFIDRRENRGKPYSLNEALARARGKYVTYLDDDDIYYRHHVKVLVDTLEGDTDCQVAYSDLYKAYCRVQPDGGREVLSKHVEISRDFDRFLMLYFNHVLHVSLMHRRDLLDRTGLYNEDLNILIDWDMTRRLAFFSDFHHVPTITGEFYSPITESDRISVQRRKDPEEYLRNILAIRTTRPAKPWPKIEDLGVVLLVDRLDKSIAEMLVRIWRYTFYPYQVYLPVPAETIARLNIEMPNVIPIPVSPGLSADERLDATLPRIEETYIAVVPEGVPVEDMWLENPLYALINHPAGAGFTLESCATRRWAAVLRCEDLQRARKAHPHLSTEASLRACGIDVRVPRAEELPFQFDELLRQAKLAETEGNWAAAAQLFEYMAAHYRNELWMKAMAARAYFEAGRHRNADRLSREVNEQRPTVDTLLLEAKIHRKRQDYSAAIQLLGCAEQWLGGSVEATAPTAPRGDSKKPDRAGKF